MEREFLESIDKRLSSRADEIVRIGKRLIKMGGKAALEDSEVITTPLDTAVRELSADVDSTFAEMSGAEGLTQEVRLDDDQIELLAIGIEIGLSIGQVMGLEATPLPAEVPES